MAPKLDLHDLCIVKWADNEISRPKPVILVCHPERSEGSGSGAQRCFAALSMTEPIRALRCTRMDKTPLSYKENFHVNNEREKGLYFLT